MRAIIVGCGRVGAGIAEGLGRSGHEVTVIDISTEAFTRLESDFPGSAIRGDGTDEAVLRRAGAAGGGPLYPPTAGDKRNHPATQLAYETLGIPNVVAKINDPVRAEAYTTLGLATICRTRMLVEALAVPAGLPSEAGSQGISQATGQHPSGDPPPRAGSPAAR